MKETCSSVEVFLLFVTRFLLIENQRTRVTCFPTIHTLSLFVEVLLHRFKMERLQNLEATAS